MARPLRIDTIGYYHLVNRGVGLREVFLSNEDRVYFISLLCQATEHYAFHIHGYALISNGYNLLIETTKNNLSHIMKLVNGNYTRYFNHKYKRRGHLWEGRFRSWHIKDKGFVLEILRYIEHLPVYTGSATEKYHYPYSTYRQFIGADERLPCLEHSIIFKQFNTSTEIKDYFKKPVDIEYINIIHQLLKQQSKRCVKVSDKKLPPLKPEDIDDVSIERRNQKIVKAYKKGYSQAKIGMVLGISQQAVYKIIKKLTRS